MTVCLLTDWKAILTQDKRGKGWSPSGGFPEDHTHSLERCMGAEEEITWHKSAHRHTYACNLILIFCLKNTSLFASMPQTSGTGPDFFFPPCSVRHVGCWLPNQRSTPCPLHWKCRVPTTGPPGRSPGWILNRYSLGAC